jgi:tetratricopeptide (TPR) repeat protein
MSKVRYLLLSVLLVLAATLLLAGCRSAHTTSAILYIDEQNYNKAVQVIHEGFEFSDNEPDAFYYLGEAYSHLAEEAVEADNFPEALKNYELAYEAYMRALELNAKDFSEQVGNSLEINYSNRLRDAKSDWDDKYYEQAEGQLRLAYAALPDSLTPIKSIARMKMQMSVEDTFAAQKEVLLEEALTLLDQVLLKKPLAYELQLDKANVLAGLGRNEDAGTIFDRLLMEHGDDAGLLGDIANLAIEDDDYARAADFYVRIVDLHEADTDAANDTNNKAMLVSAGTWYARANVGRYEDAIHVLDRAANLEIVPTDNTMLMRVRTYYNYGKHLKDQATNATDPVEKADLDTRSKAMLNRAVEVGMAMTNQFVANGQGFLFLSMAQMELGDFAASETNFKTYEQLRPETP